MIEGIFIASEYKAVINGKTYTGKCENVTKETQFNGLDKASAFTLIMSSARAFNFESGRLSVSQNRGESFQYSTDSYIMKGDHVIIVDKYKEEIPVSKSGVMTFRNGILVISNFDEKGEGITITYKKQ